jgi:putative transposase
MLIRKAFRYRLYPNAEQQQFLARQFGCCRFVYNHFLAARKAYYEAHMDDPAKKGLTLADTSRMLTELKQQPDTIWLQEANAQVLQQALKDLDTAYANFFAKRAEYPQFKRRNNRQSFRVPQHFSLDGAYLRYPKMTPIKIVLHRPLEGTPKHLTISHTPSGHYYASIVCEIEIPDPPSKAYQPEIAVDLGIKDFAVFSSGEKTPAPNYLRKAEKRLRRLQRQVSRRQKDSNGREKARRALARQ